MMLIKVLNYIQPSKFIYFVNNDQNEVISESYGGQLLFAITCFANIARIFESFSCTNSSHIKNCPLVYIFALTKI